MIAEEAESVCKETAQMEGNYFIRLDTQAKLLLNFS